jgi:hypothetical protein
MLVKMLRQGLRSSTAIPFLNYGYAFVATFVAPGVEVGITFGVALLYYRERSYIKESPIYIPEDLKQENMTFLIW